MATANTELDQATLRLVIATLATLYVLAAVFLSAFDSARLIPFLIYNSLFLVVSALLRMAIARWPGNYPARRVFAMLHDYCGIGFALVLGGEAVLPVYALMLWVTVGYGMRFGSHYLAVATALAVCALLVIYLLTPFWQQQPFVVMTLVCTTLLVPAYAHILLRRAGRATAQAEAANLEKSRFLAQASHDLRQPIHSIGLFTACLRDADLGEDERQMVDNIDKSLHSVSQLFRSILDIYTLESGKVLPRMEVVALDDILASVVHETGEAARWAGVVVHWRPSKRYVRVDPGLFTTMLQNIVSNAVKYAPGHPVLIGCRPVGERLSVVVYDRGMGIANEHLPHVFEEFYRVRLERDKDIEGVGLGLSIVQRLGRLMQLRVTIRSQLGKGTAVAIEGLETSTPKREPVRAALTTPRPLTGLNVCLVEDDRNVLLATAALLEKWGCSVETHTSAEGLDSQCDILVTDFDLGPEASGADCIERLRQQRGWAVPALIVTGHDVKKVQESLQDKQIPILSKPLRPAELRSVLLALRESAGARRKLD